jgi:hypothetical protein
VVQAARLSAWQAGNLAYADGGNRVECAHDAVGMRQRSVGPVLAGGTRLLRLASPPGNGFWMSARFRKGIAMPAAVKIKAGKYGHAIGLLPERGGAFQTRHERTLIVSAEQKKALEEAGLVEANGLKEGPGKDDGREWSHR